MWTKKEKRKKITYKKMQNNGRDLETGHQEKSLAIKLIHKNSFKTTSCTILTKDTYWKSVIDMQAS